MLTDKTQQAILALLIAMGPPCYRHFRLWSSVVIAQFGLISAYGANGATGYTLPAIGGLMVNHQLADSQQIKLLYDATERLTRKRGDTSVQSMGFLMMGSSLNHWFRAQRLAVILHGGIPMWSIGIYSMQYMALVMILTVGFFPVNRFPSLFRV